MDLIQDCPQPTGVFRPIYGPDGKPALCIQFNPDNPLMPKSYNKPAMCEWPAPHANGDAIEVPGAPKNGTITRMDQTGLTVTTNTLYGVQASVYVWIVNNGHKTVTASVDVTGFGSNPDRCRGFLAMLCRIWYPQFNRYGWSTFAYVPDHPGGGGGIVIGEPKTLGVWYRYALLLNVQAVDQNAEHAGGTARLNLTYT